MSTSAAASTASSASAATVSPSERMTRAQTIKASELEIGMRFSNVETGVVTGVDNIVKHVSIATDGGTMVVDSNIIEMQTYKIVDVVHDVIYTSKTTLIDILRVVGSHLVYVKFLKLNGDEREMYCKLLQRVDNYFGRSDVMEQVLEKDSNNKITKISYQKRQVDHRSLMELKFNGCHFIVKQKQKSRKKPRK